jgi:hypothetical protein
MSDFIPRTFYIHPGIAIDVTKDPMIGYSPWHLIQVPASKPNSWVLKSPMAKRSKRRPAISLSKDINALMSPTANDAVLHTKFWGI